MMTKLRRLLRSVHRPGKYEIKPGMTVGSLLPDVKDITQILYQIAVTAGVLIVAL